MVSASGLVIGSRLMDTMEAMPRAGQSCKACINTTTKGLSIPQANAGRGSVGGRFL